MTDRTTGSPLRVSTYGLAPSFIRVSFDQLEEVRRILNENSIPYEVREDIVSMSGGPFFAVVNLSRGVDPSRVQKILDSVR
jgi:hypothetical protein